MAAPLPASRISSLTSSTLPLILERQRSLSLNLSPSPFTESTILKNLALLTAGVRVLELEGKGVRVGAGKQVGREDASRLREGVEKLLALMEGDDEGRQKVSAIRESFHPPRTLSPPPQEPTFALGSPTFQSEGLPITSSPPSGFDPLSRPAAGGFQESYRDDENDEPYRDVSDADMLQQQQQIMEEQDSRLQNLSSSIARQHHLSLQIGDELDVHHELLEDTDRQVDRTAERLRGARRRLDSFSHKAKENGSAVTIVVLIILLAILILVFKT